MPPKKSKAIESVKSQIQAAAAPAPAPSVNEEPEVKSQDTLVDQLIRITKLSKTQLKKLESEFHSNSAILHAAEIVAAKIKEVTQERTGNNAILTLKEDSDSQRFIELLDRIGWGSSYVRVKRGKSTVFVEDGKLLDELSPLLSDGLITSSDISHLAQALVKACDVPFQTPKETRIPIRYYKLPSHWAVIIDRAKSLQSQNEKKKYDPLAMSINEFKAVIRSFFAEKAVDHPIADDIQKVDRQGQYLESYVLYKPPI